MGKVINKLKINLSSEENVLELLSNSYSINTNDMVIVKEKECTIYKNLELNTILANLVVEENSIYLEKLVSLKAFLLSKEQGMDINKLIFNINSVMNMSCGIDLCNEGIIINNNLEDFLLSANIGFNMDNLTLKDSKREASIKMKDRVIDFNTIEEIL
ncbi:MAG: hypothetical protein RR840_03290 [Clostridium sp.]